MSDKIPVNMLSVNPNEIATPDLHQYLIGAVAPRPIAFVSSISTDGVVNVAPYSFFNVFGSNPPIAVFSSNRRVRDNSTKDTYQNVMESREVVINMVNYDMVYQMALASVEYDSGISEFEKSGLTPIPSDLVKPPRVAESPVQFECHVEQIIPTGDKGGAATLFVCRIIRLHLDENILDANSRIDPQKADLMARMGRAFYCRASGDAVFPILQPVTKMGIGVDQLPDHIRLSEVLTGNDLARLASVERIPKSSSGILSDPEVMNALAGNGQDRERRLHLHAQLLISRNEVDLAWQVLLVE